MADAPGAEVDPSGEAEGAAEVTPRPALPGDLLDLLVDCSVRAVLAELRERLERGNPQGDVTDDPGDTRDDAHFGDDGRERLA